MKKKTTLSCPSLELGIRAQVIAEKFSNHFCVEHRAITPEELEEMGGDADLDSVCDEAVLHILFNRLNDGSFPNDVIVCTPMGSVWEFDITMLRYYFAKGRIDWVVLKEACFLGEYTDIQPPIKEDMPAGKVFINFCDVEEA